MPFESLYPNPFDAAAEQLDTGGATAVDMQRDDDEGIPDAAITAPEDAGAELPAEVTTKASLVERIRGFPYLNLLSRRDTDEASTTETVDTPPEPALAAEPGEAPDSRLDIHRPDILTPAQKEIAAVVDETTKDVYQTWAGLRHYPKSYVREVPGECFPLSDILQDILKKGYDIDTTMREYVPTGADLTQVRHYFLETDTGDQEFDMELDGTWHQWISKWEERPKYTEQPNVLIVPKNNLAASLTAHGVPAKYHHIWTKAQPSTSVEDMRTQVSGGVLEAAKFFVHQHYLQEQWFKR